MNPNNPPVSQFGESQGTNGMMDNAFPQPAPTASPTPPAPPPAPVISTTSGNSRAQYSNDSNSLANALAALGGSSGSTTAKTGPDEINPATYSDAYTRMLDTISSNANASTKALISSIQAARANSKEKLTTHYDNYTRGLQLLGIQHNEAQSTPDLLMGHIKAVEDEHMQKINDLDVQEKKALMDAEQAKTNNDFTTLKEKMAHVDAIKKEKADTLKAFYDNLSTTQKVGDIAAHQIYETLQGIPKNQQDTYLQAVAKKFKLPLAALVTAVSDEHVKRQKIDKSLYGKGGASGGTAVKTTLASNITKIFSNTTKNASGYSVLGSDGKIDPQAYLAAYKKWVGAGYLASEFSTKFPATKLINPASYGMLPGALRPAAAKGKSGFGTTG